MTDVKAAYAYRSETEEERAKVQAELDAEVAKVQERIAEVEAKLQEIHEKY